MTEKEDFIPAPTLAKLYEEQGNYKQALEIYKKLLKKNNEEFLRKKVEYLQEIAQNEKRKKYDEIGSFMLKDKEKNAFRISNPTPQTNEKEQDELNKIMKAGADLSTYLADRFSDLTIEQFCSFLISVIGKNRKLKDIKLSEIINALEKL